jgi:hypothetical protein
MVAAVRTRPEFQSGPPQPLFEFPFGPDRTTELPRFFTTCSVDVPRQFDVFPDGRSFVMLRDEPLPSAIIRLQVVTDWAHE